MALSPGYYRHYKNGQLYLLHALGRDTRTEEEVVIYSPCYPCEIRYFTRPVTEWFEAVTDSEGKVVERFTPLRNEDY